jgi:hypothetical protein
VVRPFSGYGADQSADFPFGAFTARAARREDPFLIWGDVPRIAVFLGAALIIASGALVIGSEWMDGRRRASEPG